jgi:hypothetical protein
MDAPAGLRIVEAQPDGEEAQPMAPLTLDKDSFASGFTDDPGRSFTPDGPYFWARASTKPSSARSSSRSLKDELLALEQRQEELERQIAQGARPQPLLHPNLAGRDRQKVADLHNALEHPTHAAEAVEKICSPAS